MTSEEKRAELARVTSSESLRNARILQKLLEFLVNRSLLSEPDEVTEATLAVEVFGREDDFDPATEATVRNSVYRLRTKLREYYAAEGRGNPVIIEIPKGHYCLSFRKRLSDGAATAGSETDDNRPGPPPLPARFWRWRPTLPVALGACLVLLVAGVWLGARWRPADSDNRAASAGLPTVDSFWHAFAGPERSVIIAYSNVEFLQTIRGDLLRYGGGAVDDRGAKVEPSVAEKSVAVPELLRTGDLAYEDGYTGIGEVNAVFYLTRLLIRAGVDVRVQRVRLLTTEDLRNRNVILLGSSLENKTVSELRFKTGFEFNYPDGPHSSWTGQILDKKRSPHQPAVYRIARDPASGALLTDYALFSVIPGITENRKVMLLGGLTTSGTQGAADFATRSAQMGELLRALSPQETKGNFPPHFEAVLEIHMVRGVDPVSVKHVASRRLAE